MTNVHTIFAFDTADSSMGRFFDNALLDLLHYFNSRVPKQSYYQAVANDFDRAFIENIISSLNEKPFLFIAYSHGETTAIICRDDYNKVVIAKGINCYLLANSFVYTFCCEIGKELGEHLVAQNAMTFIGYDKKVGYIPNYEQEFIDCANFAVKEFLTGNTIGEALEKSKKYHNQIRDTIKDPLAKITISSNKNSMVLFGNSKLVINDFI